MTSAYSESRFEFAGGESHKDSGTPSNEHSMQDLTQKIAELPWSGLIPVVVVFLTGVVMWASGRRVLRIVFAAAGVLVGTVLGLAANEVDRIAGIGMPAWSVILITAVLLGIIAAAAYRLVLAASIGLLLACLVPLGVLTAIELTGGTIERDAITVQEPVATVEPDWFAQWLDAADQELPPAEAEPTMIHDTATEDLGRWSERVQRVWTVLTELPGEAWANTPLPRRWILLAGAASGAVLGLFVGAAAPVISASMVTALGGSLLLLSSGWTMALKLRAPEQFLPGSTLQWLLWWMVAAVIGHFLQWIFRSKPADK